MHLTTRPGGMLIALVTLALLSFIGGGGAGRASAQTPAATAPSAEELLLGLLGYRLQPADLPAGFTMLKQHALTPADRAFDAATRTDEVQPALMALQATGLLTGFRQTLGPNGVTPVRVFIFETRLYASDAQASTALEKLLDSPSGTGISSDAPAVPVVLGDEAVALHLTLTEPDSNNLALEAISWRRGSLAFTMEMAVFDGTETLDQVVPLAMSADRRAAAQPPPVVSANARLLAAGDEAYRASAMTALLVRLPLANQSPIGFRTSDPTVISNADLLMDAADPSAEYARFATLWKRVIEVDRTYDTLQGASGDVIHLRYALDSEMAGASANVEAPQHEPGSTVESLALPEHFGRGGRLYHERLTGTDGVAREIWRAIWNHDQVVLTALTTGPAGDFTAADAIGLAMGLDGAYTRGPLPRVLTQPVPLLPNPLPITGRP